MKNTSELESSLNKYFHWNKARMNCFVKMLLALLVLSTSNLRKLSSGFASEAMIDSRYRRIRRFFAQFEINMNEVAGFIFNLFFSTDKKIYITIDRTNWFFGKAKINVLTLGIAYEGLAIPVFWKLLNKAGTTTGKEQIEITKRFIDYFDRRCIAGVLADREFANRTFFEWLDRNAIPFYIRIKDQSQVKFFCEKSYGAQRVFRDLDVKKQSFHIQPMWVYGQKLFLAAGRSERGELLIVATNQSPKNAVSIYLRRWEIESLFQGLKQRGFYFEDTHMTKQDRIERLMALLAIGFCFAHKVGEWKAIRKPIVLKKFKDSCRPQYSYFRYGLDLLRDTILSADRKEFLRCLKQFFTPPYLLLDAHMEAKI
jgi:hypothetical protein